MSPSCSNGWRWTSGNSGPTSGRPDGRDPASRLRGGVAGTGARLSVGPAARLLQADRRRGRAARRDGPGGAGAGDPRIRIGGAGERLPVLAIGSNAAPEVLERKFAHFPEEEDRAVLALTGRLHDFDVGFAAQPALYGSMPATLFPSPGTAVAATVLWVTPAQLTQLVWSEISYRLGRLRDPLRGRRERNRLRRGPRLRLPLGGILRRWRAGRPGGDPGHRAHREGAHPGAGPRRRRLARARRRGEGGDARPGDLRGPRTGLAPRLVETVNRESQPFGSDAWTPYGGK